jgi:hypothetical protein
VALVNCGIIYDGHHGFQPAFRDVEHAAHVILDVLSRD